MDGDLKKIRIVGEYMIEVWKAAGMNMDNVEFLWASDEINRRADDYWLRVMDIATKFNLKRMLRCCTIMGRSVRRRALHSPAAAVPLVSRCCHLAVA